MIVRNVLAKGQIVIPKTIRDLLDINVGDEIAIEVEQKKMILSKRKEQSDVFSEVCERHKKRISMKDIKDELARRYEEGEK